jgi:hypothetical protein
MPPTAKLEEAPEMQTVKGKTGTFIRDKIAGNLCAVYIHIRRPSARPQANKVEVEVPADDRTKENVKPKKGEITNPCWKIDIDQRWRQLDANRREFDAALDAYSISASIKGERLIPMTMVPECVAKLDALRTARLSIADDMYLHWDSIVQGLREHFPDVFETQIKGSLPNPGDLRNKLDAYWILKPLTPMGLDQFDLSSFNPADAAALIDRNRKNVDQMFLDGYKAVFDGVFIQLNEVLTDLATNKDYFKGRKKDSPVLDDIMTLLNKANAFRDISDNPAKLSEQINAAKKTLSQYNVSQLRDAPMLQDALRAAFAPLRDSLKELAEVAAGGRVDRTIDA